MTCWRCWICKRCVIVHPNLKLVAHFLFQQILATFGVILTAGSIVFAFSPLIQQLDHAFRPSWLLTEIHFFPVQILVGFTCGLQLAPRIKTSSALWTWVLPLVILLFAMAVSSPPDSVLIPAWKFGIPLEWLGTSTSRFWHFFGAGCEPRLRCFDQIVLTLPFYASSAYSLGMVVGRKRMSGSQE